MPDLVSGEGGGGGGGINNKSATGGQNRIIINPTQPWLVVDDEDEVDVYRQRATATIATGAGGAKDAHMSRASETMSLVDSFNEVYQRQIDYYDQNYEAMEAMRVS